MVNRVHPETGKAWNGGHDYARIERSLRNQERELGLREVKGRHFAIDGRARHQGAKRSSGDRRLSERTGLSSFGDHVRAVARRDMLETHSWAQLHERLGEVGLRLQKRGRGLVVTDGVQRVKASYVDRKASLSGLERRFGPYEPAGRDSPTGTSKRWGHVRKLRETVEEIARHSEEKRSKAAERWDRQAVERQAQRLSRRLGAASRAFDEHLEQLYRNPAAARRAFHADVKARGVDRAAGSLSRKPQSLGKLRGRGGPLSSAERWAALEVAPQAAGAARDFFSARATYNAFRGKAEGRGKSTRSVPRRRRRARRVPTNTRQLKTTATRLVKRLGWRLAARVLTPPQFQLLEITLRAGRLAVDAALAIERSAQR